MSVVVHVMHHNSLGATARTQASDSPKEGGRECSRPETLRPLHAQKQAAMERGQQVFNGMRRSNGERQMPTHENGGDDGGGGGNPKQRIYELLGFIWAPSVPPTPPHGPR